MELLNAIGDESTAMFGASFDDINNVFASTSVEELEMLDVKSTIQEKDDNLGHSIVEYCDNTDGDGFTYNTGSIKFQVRQ